MAFIIGVDAGHGHNTSGKRTPAGEREWDFNNKVLKAFITEINKYQNVIVKRYDDPTGKTDVPLRTRTDKANKDKCNLYISFHHNANTGKWGTWTGTEVHVYEKCSTTSEAYKLAAKLAPVVANAYGLKNRGIKRTNLHITRETNMTAVLIEGGFMDSKIDIVKLRNNTVLANVGKNVAKAVASFKGLKLKPTTTTTKPTTTTTTTTTGKHVVKSGETLYGIAKKYGITVANIQTWNNLKTTTLSVGQVLIVKKPTTTTTTAKPTTTSTATTTNQYHTVKKGETLWGLATKYKTTVANIQKWNGMGTSTTLTIGKKIIVGKVTAIFHTVAKGESLWAIANKYGTTVANIRTLNGLKTDVLQIGQKLIVKK